MKKALFIPLIMAVFALDVFAQIEITENVRVSAGVLRVVKFEENSFSIVLNGRIVETDAGSTVDGDVITHEENTYVGFGRHFAFNDADVVLLESSSGGNAAGVSHRVITVWRDGSASVSQYIGNGAAPRITRQGNSLLIFFPAITTTEGRMAVETWNWEGGKTTRIRAVARRR